MDTRPDKTRSPRPAPPSGATPGPHGWQRTLREIITPGVAGGLMAGVPMAFFAMLHAALVGQGALWPLHRVAEAALGAGAPTVGNAVVGALVHLAVAAVWGVLFVALVPRGAPYAAAALMGLIFGLVVFLVMTWLVLPQVQPAFLLAVPGWVFFAYHLLFGLLLPLAVPFRRQISRGLTADRPVIP